MIVMIDNIQVFLSHTFIIIGSIFLVIGSIGLIRMPDVFTRMHAVSVMETSGASMIIFGLIIHSGINSVSLKLLIIILSIFYISSVATHALARACIHDNIKPLKIKKDN